MKSAFRQTIFTKPLLILSIPLIVQGLLIYKISQDLDKEERISVQLDRARDEIDTVNRIYAQEAMVGNELFRLVDSPDGLDELFERNYKDFLKDANHLRRLLRDNPKQLAELKRKTDSAKKFV